MSIGRNDPCPCGSGKKYKKCCIDKHTLPKVNTENDFFEKLINGELPFRVECGSTCGEPVSMSVSNAIVTVNGVSKVIQQDPIVLKTTPTSQANQESRVVLEIPLDDDKNGEINIVGGASIGGLLQRHYKPAVPSGKKLRVEGSDKLFASISIGKQKDSGFEYFDVYFGEKGRAETMFENGKDRPHLAFYTDGNGKYSRLSDYKCEIKSKLSLERGTDNLFPKHIEISVNEYAEILQLVFEYDKANQVVSVVDARFIKL